MWNKRRILNVSAFVCLFWYNTIFFSLPIDLHDLRQQVLLNNKYLLSERERKGCQAANQQSRLSSTLTNKSAPYANTIVRQSKRVHRHLFLKKKSLIFLFCFVCLLLWFVTLASFSCFHSGFNVQRNVAEPFIFSCLLQFLTAIQTLPFWRAHSSKHGA